MKTKKINIGITGQSGFLGTHLYNTIGLYSDEFQRIPFSDDFFEKHEKLTEFVKKCDVIVHLAAMNRHHDPEKIYKTNIDLVRKLTKALEATGTHPHLLISSSIQENLDNPYGRSKKEAREALADWTEKNKAPFTGFLFPNIFGPFGKPFYNSFISTFSHLLNTDGQPAIEVDQKVPLLYVADAVAIIIDAIRKGSTGKEIRVPHNKEKKVTEVLELLEHFKSLYSEQGIIPPLHTKFETNLFNTFRSYIDLKKHYPVPLKLNTDDRGSFVEIIKCNSEGQFSFSTTKPGITRGNHFHTRKIERFAVIKGKALIQLRKIRTNEILEFELNGNQPSFVDMPIWYTHNITNIGKEDLYTLFWINEFYNPDDPDTYYVPV